MPVIPPTRGQISDNVPHEEGQSEGKEGKAPRPGLRPGLRNSV
jgi:hypothetical protein